jgi:hypothetical protein
MTITTADARNILNDHLAEPAPLNDTIEAALDLIVPEGENRDYYRGMIAGMMLASESIEGGDADTIRQAVFTFKHVMARAAGYVVEG